jgi:hypothetical protein
MNYMPDPGEERDVLVHTGVMRARKGKKLTFLGLVLISV